MSEEYSDYRDEILEHGGEAWLDAVEEQEHDDNDDEEEDGDYVGGNAEEDEDEDEDDEDEDEEEENDDGDEEDEDAGKFEPGLFFSGSVTNGFTCKATGSSSKC